MIKGRILVAGAIALTASAIAGIMPGDAATRTIDGAAIFEARCKSCHDPAVARAPSKMELFLTPRADIVSALETGVMAPMSKRLSKPQIEAVAAFLTPIQHSWPTGVDKPCDKNEAIEAGNSDWSTLGQDSESRRYQPNPSLSASDVPRLKVKWAFAMPGGGQPVVVGNWLFVTNSGDRFYALDAKTGCIHWTVRNASSKTTPAVVRSANSPSGWATFVGVGKRGVRAFDAQTGKELWHSKPVDDPEHPTGSWITGTPVVTDDQIFVPISSHEEMLAMQPDYPCCAFRGSLLALDIKTGRKQWQTFMIREPLRPTKKNKAGVQMQGPAGGAIWASPTVDAERGLVYVVTADSYTDVPTKGTDAIVAVEMKTGKIRWRNQVTAGDNYIMGCGGPQEGPNCPSPTGPDFDFGATPILFKSGDRQVLVAGQKSGVVYGVDPDTGHTLWKTTVGDGSALGGVEWGIAADDKYVFVPISDIFQVIGNLGDPKSKAGKPGLYALDPLTGAIVWSVPAPVAPCHYAGDRSTDYTQGACVRAQSAAPGAMPGVVFSGTLDGWFRAYDATSGKILWAFSTTAQTYETVNGFRAQPGGGIDGMGPTISGGMVYTMSGFNGGSNTGSNGTNVLLAFSLDGK